MKKEKLFLVHFKSMQGEGKFDTMYFKYLFNKLLLKRDLLIHEEHLKGFNKKGIDKQRIDGKI
ncbi:hypothetical protein CN679_01855 [Bacillus pseudomycoides]|nr:hypothetical protein CN679_01855 [Bacillus pseudomycoides]